VPAAAEPTAARRARAHAHLTDAWLTRGPLACALWPLSWVYGGVMGLRRAAYRHGALAVSRLPVPVVVVGNLVAGGAGKTPTVLAVVAHLLAHGHRPGIVSRGYGGSGGGSGPIGVGPDTPAGLVGDEPLLLRLRSGVPVWVGRDRPAAARALLAHHPETSVIVSDDGLQHLALARDLQIVVFDERGAGNGWLLPAGPLREPMPAGDTWSAGIPTRVLYNAPAPTTRLAGGRLGTLLAGAVPLSDWWAGAPARHEDLAALRGRRTAAAAGTARPGRFFAMLQAAGLEVDPYPLPDHHDFRALPWPADTTVLVTEKDAIKLAPDRPGTAGVLVVPLDSRLDADTEAALDALPAPPRRP
jgi:tetraacyldisaccharide 4'-kinase